MIRPHKTVEFHSNEFFTGNSKFGGIINKLFKRNSFASSVSNMIDLFFFLTFLQKQKKIYTDNEFAKYFPTRSLSLHAKKLTPTNNMF